MKTKKLTLRHQSPQALLSPLARHIVVQYVPARFCLVKLYGRQNRRHDEKARSIMAMEKSGVVLQELYKITLALLAVTGYLLTAKRFSNLPAQPLHRLVSPFSIAS
jgi:hypothetical protein